MVFDFQMHAFKVPSLIATLSRLARFLLLSTCLIMMGGVNVFAEVTIITNKNVDVVSLSRKDLRSAFTMKKKYWENGQPVKVFVLPHDNDAHKSFCRKVLKIFPRQLESVWYRMEFSGTGTRPTLITSVDEMKNIIRSTPGAIGYIPNEFLDDTVQQLEIK